MNSAQDNQPTVSCNGRYLYCATVTRR